MEARNKFLTRVLKEHDKHLFVDRNKLGINCVWRKHKKFELSMSQNGVNIYSLIPDKQYVFALTSNWRTNGIPIEYGSEVILKRIREHDLQSNEALFKQLEDNENKVDEAKKRKVRNDTESYLADRHSQIKKAWSDVRYANLSMDDSRSKKKYYKE